MQQIRADQEELRAQLETLSEERERKTQELREQLEQQFEDAVANAEASADANVAELAWQVPGAWSFGTVFTSPAKKGHIPVSLLKYLQR